MRLAGADRADMCGPHRIADVHKLDAVGAAGDESDASGDGDSGRHFDGVVMGKQDRVRRIGDIDLKVSVFA